MRLHSSGFLHKSVFARNILVQPGPIHLSPAYRSVNTPSFRLIDFGRSYFNYGKYDNNFQGARMQEESQANEALQTFYGLDAH